MKIIRAIQDWLEPYHYQRATYATHLRVRVLWWVRFALGGIIASIVGWALAVGALAMVVIGMEHGLSHVNAEDIIGLFSALVCRTHCTADTLAQSTVSVGVMAWALGWVAWIVFVSEALKPGGVSEDELAELRQLGYIVMDGEEACLYADDGYCPHWHPADRCTGCVPESVKLDSAGPADCRDKAPAEGDRSSASLHSGGVGPDAAADVPAVS